MSCSRSLLPPRKPLDSSYTNRERLVTPRSATVPPPHHPSPTSHPPSPPTTTPPPPPPPRTVDGSGARPAVFSPPLLSRPSLSVPPPPRPPPHGGDPGGAAAGLEAAAAGALSGPYRRTASGLWWPRGGRALDGTALPFLLSLCASASRGVAPSGPPPCPNPQLVESASTALACSVHGGGGG